MMREQTRGASAAAAIAAALAAGCGGLNRGDMPPQVVEDMSWMALVDGSDPGGESFDDAPRMIRLSDFFAANRPGTKLILIAAAAGWCVPCQAEAGALNDLAADYGPRGVAVMTAVFQDEDANPATEEFAREWGRTFALTVPVIIDSSFATGRYFDVAAMPSSMLIDADSGEILAIQTGTEAGADPLAAHRRLLDGHLAD